LDYPTSQVFKLSFARGSIQQNYWLWAGFYGLIPRMKSFGLAIVIVLLGQASAQTLVEKLFLVRSDTTTVDPYSGMTRICVVVLADGHYRVERSFQSVQGGASETKIFLDTLPAEDLKNLQAALDSEDLQRIKTPPARGGIIQEMDMLSLSIPREHTLQNIDFQTAAQRKPYDKALKPFLTSLKAIEKRKVPVAKNETPNNCEAPRVMYRTVFPGASNPDVNMQQP